MSITKDVALDFFSDLLGTPKKDTLFVEPVKKTVRFQRRWKVTSLTIIHQETECRCCGASIRLVNPHLLLTKSLNDYDGKIIKTMETDCPEDIDLKDLSPDLPILTQTVKAGHVDVCSQCIDKKSPDALRALFQSQVSRLKADPERRKAAVEKAEKAEKELFDLVAAYEQTATAIASDESALDKALRDADLPY